MSVTNESHYEVYVDPECAEQVGPRQAFVDQLLSKLTFARSRFRKGNVYRVRIEPLGGSQGEPGSPRGEGN